MAEYVCERQARRGNSPSPGNRPGQASFPQAASRQAEPGRSGNFTSAGNRAQQASSPQAASRQAEQGKSGN